MRKKYQNYFNKKIKQMNKGIYDDNLWKGRFVFRQIAADWERFDDNSGGLLWVILRAYDKETDQYRDFGIETAPWRVTLDWHLAMDVANKFIVDDIDAWHEEINPYKNEKDWRKIKVRDEVWHRPLDQWMRGI